MKKILLSLAVILMNISVSAKGIKVVSDIPVTIPDGEACYSPLLSPAGDYILLTNGSMNGLKKYDLATGVVSNVTKDKGAGYNAKISSDGKVIVYRKSKFKKHLRYTSVKSINLETGKVGTLVKDSRKVTEYNVVKGTALALENGKVKSKRMYGAEVKYPVIVSVDNGDLMLTLNGHTRKITPCGDTRYMWQSLSPDCSKILFAIPGEGTIAYVCNLDGSNPVRLGRMSAPRWMGNDWVVGMDDRDNGIHFTESAIVAVRTDGSDYTKLTSDDKIAMYPSASRDASKIVYNTSDGKIYIMTVKAE